MFEKKKTLCDDWWDGFTYTYFGFNRSDQFSHVRLNQPFACYSYRQHKNAVHKGIRVFCTLCEFSATCKGMEDCFFNFQFPLHTPFVRIHKKNKKKIKKKLTITILLTDYEYSFIWMEKGYIRFPIPNPLAYRGGE